MPYAEPVNVTGLTGMFQYANNVTNNVFVVLLLVSCFIIPLLYLIFRGFDWRKSSLAAGFITSMVTILMRVSGVVTQDKYIFIAIASIIVPLVLLLLSDSST